MRLESLYDDNKGLRLGRVMALIIGVIVFFGIIAICLWAFGVFTAPIKGQGDVQRETHEADFMMEAYNSFYDQFHSILGLEGSIDETVKQLEMLEKGSKDYNRVLTNLTALKSMRHQAIQKYNADARKDWTVGQFREADLPYQIEDSEYPPEGSN